MWVVVSNGALAVFHLYDWTNGVTDLVYFQDKVDLYLFLIRGNHVQAGSEYQTIIRAINVFLRHRKAPKLRYMIKSYPLPTSQGALSTEPSLRLGGSTGFSSICSRSDPDHIRVTSAWALR